MSNDQPIFPDGLKIEEPSSNAPAFIIAKVGVKVDAFTAFLQTHANANGWVNLEFLRNRQGKPYMKLDNWKPSDQGPGYRQPSSAPAPPAPAPPAPPFPADPADDDIPF